MKKVIKLPVIKQKNFITTKTIKSNPSFLITLDHDKKHLRVIKWNYLYFLINPNTIYCKII